MKIIVNRLCEVVPYFVACLIWAGAVIMDVVVLKTNCAENGFVEESCELFGYLVVLAWTIAFFLRMANRRTSR